MEDEQKAQEDESAAQQEQMDEYRNAYRTTDYSSQPPTIPNMPSMPSFSDAGSFMNNLNMNFNGADF